MSPLNARQEQLLKGLAASDARLGVRIDDLRGIVALARGTLVEPGSDQADPEAIVRRFLESAGELFGPTNALSWLRLLRRWRDPVGSTHLEYQQEHDQGSGTPLEVYGAKLVAHVHGDGTLAEVQSSCWPSVEVPGQAQVNADALRAQLLKAAATSPDFPQLSEMMAAHGESGFPLMQPARLVAYFWRDRFYLAWTSYAYVPVPELRPPGAPTGALRLELRHILFDAVTGAEILTSPTSMHVDNPVLGSGLSVQGSRPAPINRVLKVVQENATTTHRLRDTTHAREIITYDAAQNPAWTTKDQIGMGFIDGTLPESTSITGSNWGTTSPPASRKDSQQPEVDAHFLTGRVYEWYDAVSGGRAGWDDGKYPASTVPPNLPVRVVTHVPPDKYVNSMMNKFVSNNHWYPFLMFWDCDLTLTCSTAADRAQDYWAGSLNIVAHEYQHAITAFSFQDGVGNPGIQYAYWSAALHEGLADAFAVLCSENWSWGAEVSPAGMVIRSAAYPRDPGTWENSPALYPCSLSQPASLQHSNKDHFADQNMNMVQDDVAQAYNHGTILAHCAYLMGQGGVHQRITRAPALIPVEGLGHETLAGLSVVKAARIWYHALVDKLAAYVGAATGDVQTDAHVFYAVGDGCVSTAALLFGAGGVEHRTAALAVYAVGLQEPGTLYGADVTFLRWGWEWRYSRPYLGGIYANAPDWASLDLFVNNGGGSSGWTAVIDPGNLATPPENQVYCRVRNVGDQDASGVTVAFWYAKISAVAGPWQPVTDGNGNVQTLTIGVLPAGQMTFGDTQMDQDAPPAAAMIRWWIPPLVPGEVVDHFCLRAVVTSTNDVNPHNNEVQSNIAYVPYSSAQPRALRLWNEAVLHHPGPVETVVLPILPPRWRVTGPTPGAPPHGHEGYASSLSIEMPADARDRIEAPFDGEFIGQLTGSPSGNAHGALTALTGEPPRLRGRVALTLPETGMVLGIFEGSLDVHTAAVSGRVTGAFQKASTGRTVAVSVRLEGHLMPWRRVDVSQRVDGQTLGGLTVQIYGGTPGAHD